MAASEPTPQLSGRLLPGEDAPLPMRRGGAPIRPEEALGVARRLARVAASVGRRGASAAIPDQLPGPGDARQMTALRLPGAVTAYARARAEMEGYTLTDVIVAALEAYGAGSPGRPTGFRLSPEDH